MADQTVGVAARGSVGVNPNIAANYPEPSESIARGAPVNLDSSGVPRRARAASDSPDSWPTVGLATRGYTLTANTGTFGQNNNGFGVQNRGSLDLTEGEVEQITDNGDVLQSGKFYYVSSASPGKITATVPTGGAAITPIGIAQGTTSLLIILGAPVAST